MPSASSAPSLTEKIEEKASSSKESPNTSAQEKNENNADLDAELEKELAALSPPPINYEEKDPLEKMNRVLYGLHRGLDLLFVRPLALTYGRAMPKPLRKGLYNFVSNATAPLRFFCRILQGNWEEAGKTVGRFATNTLLGCGGIFDVAGKMKCTEKKTGFSETLKKWGIRPGPYIVVPGFGPSTFRNAFGLFLDSFCDPLFLLSLNKKLPGNERHELMLTYSGIQLMALLMERSEIDPLYEGIEKSSVGRYRKLRMLVLQQDINQ